MHLCSILLLSSIRSNTANIEVSSSLKLCVGAGSGGGSYTTGRTDDLHREEEEEEKEVYKEVGKFANISYGFSLVYVSSLGEVDLSLSFFGLLTAEPILLVRRAGDKHRMQEAVKC